MFDRLVVTVSIRLEKKSEEIQNKALVSCRVHRTVLNLIVYLKSQDNLTTPLISLWVLNGTLR